MGQKTAKKAAWDRLTFYLNRNYKINETDLLPVPNRQVTLVDALAAFEKADKGASEKMLRQLQAARASRDSILAAMGQTYQEMLDDDAEDDAAEADE